MADPHGPAIAAITRVLARARDDGADDEVTARHILTALTGHGWRLTNAQPAPAGGPVSPPTDEFRAARAAIGRHADHGPEVTCRPAGHGLCEPARGPGGEPGGFVPWHEATPAQVEEFAQKWRDAVDGGR